MEILSSPKVLILCLSWIFVIDSNIFNIGLKCDLSRVLSSLVPPLNFAPEHLPP